MRRSPVRDPGAVPVRRIDVDAATNRFGSFARASRSASTSPLRAGSASTFFETKTRPVVVAAQAVDVSAACVRSTAARRRPRGRPSGRDQRRRVDLHPVAARHGERAGPLVADRVAPARASSCPMPWVFVRQTSGRCRRTSSAMTTGSVMIGGVERVGRVPVDRVGRPVPVGGVAVGEVHLGRGVEERVEAEVRDRRRRSRTGRRRRSSC